MIIFRYLIKEVYSTLLAATGVLLLVLISNQFIHYLTQAAAGVLPLRTVMQMMSLQVPLLLGLLLPLGLFIGILLAYGRLHNDQEMTILSACGFSKMRLIGLTLMMAAVVTIVVGILMLWLQPKVEWYKRHILLEAAQSSPLERMYSDQFMPLANGGIVLYVDQVSRDHQQLQGVFAAQQRISPTNGVSWNIVTAKDAHQMLDPQTQDQFLVLENGYRYTGLPGQKDFQRVKFDQYGVRIEQNLVPLANKMTMLPTHVLWQMRHTNPEAEAALQWRISLPLSVLVLALLAVPLSQVKPRQGRYAQLLPAILLYIVYADLLFMSQAWLQKNEINASLGMWWVHLMMLFIAGLLTCQYVGWIQLKSLWTGRTK